MVRHPSVLLVVSAFVLAAFGGCLAGAPASDPQGSDAPDDTGGPTAGIETSQAIIPTGGAQPSERGAIHGQVLNTDGVGVAKASVILIGWPNSTVADEMGRFAINNVKPDKYTLRVDAPRYNSLENAVEIDAGRITTVVVRLLPTEAVLGFRDHVHDLWEGKPTKILLDKDFDFPWSVAQGGEAPPPDHCQKTTGRTFETPGEDAVMDDDAVKTFGSDPCYVINVPLEKIIPPGAVQLNVTIGWKSATYVPTVKFRYSNLTSNAWKPTTAGMEFTNGETKTIELWPSETDSGHAKYSGSTFQLYVESVVGGQKVQSGDLIRRDAQPFHVKAEAVRGAFVPAEAPHDHYWINGSVRNVVTGLSMRMTEPEYPRDPRTRVPASDVASFGEPHLILPPKMIIPPGTTRLNVTLTYTHGAEAVDAYLTKKTLAFRTAKLSPTVVSFEDLLVPTPTFEARSVKYSFEVAEDESDAFYHTKSSWLFLLSNQDREREDNFINECGARTACSTTYALTVDAINENWAEDFEAGRI